MNTQNREYWINKIKQSNSNEIIEIPFELTKEEIELCYKSLISKD